VAVPPVRVDVLGPLQLTVGGEVVDVPGPKRRALLALLAMAEDRAVPTSDLFDALWPGEMPDSARATLQSHVSRLRRHLGQAAPRLEGASGSYRLHLDDDGCGTDVARAGALLDAASTAEAAEAWQLLTEARSLWRGQPLAEFDDVGPLAARAVALRALRDRVDLAAADAAIDSGAPTEAVEIATASAARDPLSEAAVLVLMRALDVSGRVADALRAGHDHRLHLLTETGLRPSPALAELERDIASRTTTPTRGLTRAASGLRGRESELAAVQRLLAGERLVTLLGPGGVGKSALAAEVAQRADHVSVVLLAPVTEPAALPQALAAALDLRVVHGDVLSACVTLLAAGQQLLVLDNCEHLLPSVRDIVAALVDGCPQLSILATSREPLGHPSEQQFRLAPLAVTTPVGLDDLTRTPAVAMFVDRARRVRPDFAPTPGDLRVIGDIVRRLDGLPLAIELAASRLSTLGLHDLHVRLDRALDLLGDGRAATLRHTVAWSYDLLPDHEQQLFRHLGVFPDGFDLATAETVAADLGVPGDVTGALAHLVDASMIEVDLTGAPRYRMLDTIRSYARNALVAADEHDSAAEAFLQWALRLAAWFDHTIDTDHEPHADRVLRNELSNLSAAWRQARTAGPFDAAVRLVVTFGDAATWRDLTEVWDWALELVDDPRLDDHADAAAVLGIAAGNAWSRGDLPRAEQLARRGLDRRHPDAWRCRSALALVALSHGHLDDAANLATQAAAAADRVDQSLGVAALAWAYSGDLTAAARCNDRLATVASSPTLCGFHRYVAGEIDGLADRTDDAEQHYQCAIADSRASGATFLEGIASVGLVTARADAGRLAEALDGYQDLLDYWARTGGWIQQWTTLRNLAHLLHTIGDEETALYLETAADDAPDAPLDATRRNPPAGLTADQIASTTAAAHDASRLDILDVARRALDRHLQR
jgi:predicted ATPase/DNA-binding SARP family transcriptional activator